jgi:hypothetical protein
MRKKSISSPGGGAKSIEDITMLPKSSCTSVFPHIRKLKEKK